MSESMMELHPYDTKPAGCCESFSPPPEIDALLAAAGYAVRPSDLRHVAERLQQLDSAMIAGGLPPDFLSSDTVHYNPSDLTSWVDSILTEMSPPDATWTNEISPPTAFPAPSYPPPSAFFADPHRPGDEQGAGIRLVHLLMTCADSIQRREALLASTLVDEMRFLLPRISSGFGISKVAGFFLDALDRRLRSLPPPDSAAAAAAEDEILYHHFYEGSPILKFAHFTANQAILEAIDGCARVHVIDLGLMHGLQWPALIQALALRPGGPPFLRLTGIGPAQDALCEVGLRLAELARSLGVPFVFHPAAVARLDDLRSWMVRVEPGETLAVNSIFQLHRVLGPPGSSGPVDSVLSWLRGLQPRIATVVEQEADHNKQSFLDRFTEALFYYSTVFDSLEAGGGGVEVAELYLQREICNIVCCEGADRVERHEPLARWRTRLGRAGLQPLHLGSNAFRQASMLLNLFSSEGYGVEEVNGCLTLGWHGRALISASAWHAGDDMAAPPAGDIFLSNHNNLVNWESSGMSHENAGYAHGHQRL